MTDVATILMVYAVGLVASSPMLAVLTWAALRGRGLAGTFPRAAQSMVLGAVALLAAELIRPAIPLLGRYLTQAQGGPAEPFMPPHLVIDGSLALLKVVGLYLVLRAFMLDRDEH